MLEMLGVVKLVTPLPPARTDPPVAVPYQSMVSPVPTVAVRGSVPGPHLVKGPAPAVGTFGGALTVTNIGVRVRETQVVSVLRASA